MTILKYSALGLALLVGALLAFAATKPDHFRIERSVTLKTTPDKIFPLINDFSRWGAWSPYEKKDPAMKRIFSGPAAGPGAVYAWEGNKDVGQGRMEITQAAAPTLVALKLDFVKPFEAHNRVDFTLESTGDATEVTWAMHGPMPFLSKVMTVFFDMDQMVGKDFEAGLAGLKALAEK